MTGYEYQSEFARKYVDQGRKEILLTAIEALTEVLGIELSAEQRETLDNAGVQRLAEIHEALRSSRQWPAAQPPRPQAELASGSHCSRRTGGIVAARHPG